MGQFTAPLVGFVVVFALFATTLAALLVDALYQIVMGKPSLIPLQRLIRRRVPASAQDCVVEGAAKAFLAVGLGIVNIPLGLYAAIVLITPWAEPSPLAQLPGSIFVGLTVGWVVCFHSASNTARVLSVWWL